MSNKKYKTTLFVPLSRKGLVDDMIAQINKIDEGRHSITCLIVVDNLDIDVNKLRDGIRFPVEIVSTGNRPPQEANVAVRRDRITGAWKLAQQNMPLDCDLVFCLEDDSAIKPSFLMDLTTDFENLDALKVPVGFVSGVEAGRWGYKIVGAWRCDNPKMPTKMQSVPYQTRDLLSKVDAAGFYCMLTTRDNFMEVTPEWRRFGFGPDVNFGLILRGLGYTNVIDWSVRVGHITQSGILEVDKDCVSITYENENDTWKITQTTQGDLRNTVKL